MNKSETVQLVWYFYFICNYMIMRLVRQQLNLYLCCPMEIMNHCFTHESLDTPCLPCDG